jgi:hemerythrin-like domain-containing protein
MSQPVQRDRAAAAAGAELAEGIARRQAARALRDKAGVPDGFASLDAAHQAALGMIDALDRLLVRLENQGLDADARAAAQQVLDFFNGPGHHHHAEEESRVFPELLASGDAELIHHVGRLREDHGWIEEDWLLLAPQIEAIAQGYSWFDLSMLRLALPVFADLHREHIALEETVVYPAARAWRAKQADAAKARASA